MYLKRFYQRIHFDPPLVLLLCLVSGLGLLILYSASNQEMQTVVRQLARLGIACVLAFLLAQITPSRYLLWAPWFFVATLTLLIVVLVIGHIGKGAQRWLNLWLFRFQ